MNGDLDICILSHSCYDWFQSRGKICDPVRRFHQLLSHWGVSISREPTSIRQRGKLFGGVCWMEWWL